MIHLNQSDNYELIETGKGQKILRLGKHWYIWLKPKNISEIMLISRRKQAKDTVLSRGQYRYFEVANEPDLSDGYHLELSIGDGNWQGYIMPDGLPDAKSKMNGVFPTHEQISGEHKLWPAHDLTDGSSRLDELTFDQAAHMFGGLS